MPFTATASIENPQTKAALLGHVIDSLVEITRAPRAERTNCYTFSALKSAFEETKDLPKSLLVVRVANDRSVDEKKPSTRLAQQELVTQQLQAAGGRRAKVAAIGNQEYAVLLLGIDQCGALIPRLKNLLSRTAAGHLNGDGSSLDCRIGVARCPIDTDELSDLVRMASRAATELRHCELGYQFINRRHR